MTQAIYRELLIVKLIPLRLPEANLNTLPIQRAEEEVAGENPSLLLVPGEPSELLVQLENLGTHTLELAIELTSELPSDWCNIDNERTLLNPEEKIDVALRFQTPTDFFENSYSLRAGQVIKLDYQVRLTISGSQPGTTPRLLEVANFNLYVRPLTRYQEFLPKVYQEIDFVGRFLQIFEATLEPDVQILANLWAYLDPLTAPTGMLEFLAHWVGWKIQPYLSLEQQRYLIRHAIEIYCWRGTRKGLRFYLHLATGLPLDEHLANEREKHIGIFEFFSQGFVLGETSLAYDATLGGIKPFHFTVRLRFASNHPINEPLIRTIIEQEKPAFCSYDLIIETE